MTYLTDDERGRLYGTLLRGLANQAQDQLCTKDEHHAWGEWVRSEVKRDTPLKFISDPEELAREMNRKILIRSERRCLNCGKEQVSLP